MEVKLGRLSVRNQIRLQGTSIGERCTTLACSVPSIIRDTAAGSIRASFHEEYHRFGDAHYVLRAELTKLIFFFGSNSNRKLFHG